jgi:P27 family predicted phage terminase small subunit
MGKGGHNKKPTQAKIIQGTFRKDRAPAKEPKPEKVSNVPKPPAYLSKYAKKVWKDLAEELVEKGILTVVDLPALEACCEAYGQYRLAFEAVFRPVDPETGKKGKRTLARYMKGRNSQTMPEYTAMNKAWATFKSFLTEFGLTPASRTKLEIAEPKGKGEDPMEKLWNEA